MSHPYTIHLIIWYNIKSKISEMSDIGLAGHTRLVHSFLDVPLGYRGKFVLLSSRKFFWIYFLNFLLGHAITNARIQFIQIASGSGTKLYPFPLFSIVPCMFKGIVLNELCRFFGPRHGTCPQPTRAFPGIVRFLRVLLIRMFGNMFFTAQWSEAMGSSVCMPVCVLPSSHGL
jgi:hypothetical protein